jgi:predicted peptidase
LLSAGWAQQRESDKFEARSFKLSNGTTMVYRLFKPKDYDPSKKYPIVSCLHGIGEKGNDNRVQIDREDLAHPWIEDSVQARVPHFIMVPQCPSNLFWWSSNTGKGPISEADKGVIGIVDSLKKEFSIDTNRVYITGLSMGGMGTWDLLRTRPGYFTAAIPCAGLGDPDSAAKVSQSCIWAFHGLADGTVRLSLDGTSPKMMDAIEKLGKKVVRFVSQAPFNGTPGLNDYSNALKIGDPLQLVALNPTGISWDSLTRAVKGGADYLYSSATNGDHRTGWMIAWHNPLVATWLFSKTKDRSAVTLAPKLPAVRNDRKATLLLSGNLPDGLSEGWTPVGRRIGSGSGMRAAAPVLLVRPLR